MGMTETAILKTAAHELTHFIQANSARYEALKSFVVNKLTHEEGVSFEDLVADKQRREPGLEYDEAVDEVVADACEMMLGDSTVVEQLAKENRSLAEKIRDWLREWVENLKIALEGLQADRTESRAMMQYARELQEIWDNALMDAARNNRGTARETAESRQSIRETCNGKKYVKADRQVLFGSDPDSWSEQLEDYINGKIRRGQDVPLIAEDGDVLLLTRTSAGKLSDNHTSDGRTMSDAAFERKANAAAHIDELVEVSSKGKKTIIDKDARHGDMASGGWNYRTAYFMDFDGKYYKTTISVAEGSGGSIVYNVGHMKEEVFPKIKGSYAEKGNGPRGNTSTNSIRQSNDNSQEKSSDKVQSSMRDSAGRELTEAQQAYFKDSKVRDADGRLKTMYRGGNGTFTVFDRQRSKPSNLYGRGFYFTDSKEHANQYGKAREFYLNITHPVPMQETTITRIQLRKFLEAVAENDEDFSFENYGYGATVDSVQESVFGKSDFAMLYDVNQTAIGDMVAAVELFNEINGTDFDGLILDTETVAFRSEQIKSTNNLAPTKDTDIRYQQRDNLKEEYHLTDDEESAIRGAAREAIPAESRRQAQAESGESIEPGEKPLKGKHDNDKMGAVKDSLKEDLKNGKARKEDRGAFLRRATGEGLRVFEGDSIAYGYRSVRREFARENARQVQKELTALGIDAEITDGYVHWNLDGISCKRAISQAVTIERRRILISNRVSLPSKNAAGHEAFHLWGSTQAREAYANEVADNLNYSSREFVEYQAVIAEAYLGGEADLSDSTQLQKLREELFAYISGDIHEGVNDDLLRPMFHDYDAVKAAWVKLCKDNSDGEVRFSLRSVPPVKPKNGGWERGATFDEVKTEHPTLFALDADESSTRNPTQISGTVKSYRKIFDALKEEGFDGTILDASSGLGYGTRLGREEYGYRVDDIEPFPDAKYKPRYTDYSALDNTYDAIISNAVLNVIPQDLRDAMVVKIGEMLNPGGRAFINVRGTDVKNASSKVAINESGMEYFISNTGSYQKGFTTKELVAYLRDALGDGFTVRATNKFGAVSAIVTKNEERVQSQQREPRLSDRDVLRMAADMAQRDRS